MSKLSFSVVTVSYNHGEFIRAAIESVQAQNYDNFEHIIVDGGSTDNTVEILKEYPHLKWTSEPDRGQTHGLEKGFRRATGDIIAWLNSDDFYEPGVFSEIAQQLEDYPILLTKAGRTDRAGALQEVVPNVPRSFFDLLKFWAPYAWLAQTGVFFRRSVLEEVKRSDGSFLNEELYYSMDFDLWLRMAKKYPFDRYLDKTCAYFRMYDDNKTGKEGGPTQRECARVYRRHRNELVNAERKFSFAVMVDGKSDGIADTLNSIVAQELNDSEILLVGYGSSINEESIRSFALEVDEKLDSLNIRHTICESSNFYEACNHAGHVSKGESITFLRTGDQLPASYCKMLFNHFATLLRGVIYPMANHPELVEQITKEISGLKLLTVDGVCRAPIFSSILTIHKACFMDLNGFSETNCLTAVRTLLLDTMQNSWHVEIDVENSYQESYGYEKERELFTLFQPLIAAHTIVHADNINNADKFKNYLLQTHNSGVNFEDNVVESAREFLAKAPVEWLQLDNLISHISPEKLVEDYPSFSPGWEYLRQKAEKAGDTELAQKAQHQFTELRNKEPFLA